MPSCLIVQPSLHLSRRFIDTPMFANMGAYQAAAGLRARGWSVRVVDGFDQTDADLFDRTDSAWLGQARRAFLERLETGGQDLILVVASAFLLAPWARAWLKELVDRLSAKGGAPVVLADMYAGGMHYLHLDPQRLRADLPGLDGWLRYEGEGLVDRLAAQVEAGSFAPFADWAQRRPLDLSGLPAPAWELMDLEAYFGFLHRVLASPWRAGVLPPEPRRSLPLITARGCPYDCIFCTHGPGLAAAHRHRVRRIPWERVAGWLEGWKADWGLQRVVVLDEIPNLDAGRFKRLLELAATLELELAFPNGLRADALDREQLELVKRVCGGIKVSLESASPRIQREVLKKRLDPASVARVAAWCAELELGLQIHYLVGLPTERRDELLATLATAEVLAARYGAQPLIQYPVPLPGTELARRCPDVAGGAGQGEPDLHACFQSRALVATGELRPAEVEALVAGRLRAQAGPDRSAAPKVIVNLTYRCNNHCRFCAVGDRPRRDAETPAVIEALKRHRARGASLLDIDGGEPSLHPDLFEVIAAGRRLGYQRIGLITNGRRASYPAFARRLAASGLDEVLVSLHAAEPRVHDHLTRAPGSFAQTLDGIANLLAQLPDPDRLAVNTTLVAGNLEGLPALGRRLAELGVRRWNLQLLTPFGRARRQDMPHQADLKTRLVPLLADPPAGLHVQVVNCPPCLLPGHEQAAAADFGKAGRQMVFIGEQGVNLQGFLAGRRALEPECVDCAWALACAGPYRFEPEDG